jgi:hypothetical protein
MVFFMSLYNITLHQKGFSSETVVNAFKGFLPGFICGFIFDWFVVSKPAKALAFSMLKPEDKPIKKIIIVSSCMVSGMVLCMSFYGAVINVGFTDHLLMAYLTGILKNFVAAIPLQLLIAGPIIRFVFGKIFANELRPAH